MALPGMKSTADFVTDERPKNWREGIFLLEPRNKASLYRLTAMMDSDVVDDPEFSWWEEPVDMYTYTANGALAAGATTVTVDAKATMLTAGDMLRVSSSGEVIQVVTVVNTTSFTVSRAMGPVGSAAGTAAAIADNDKLLYIGSAYREGAPRARGTSSQPSKKFNYTQIFRTPLEMTRTAQKTRYRTGDPMKNEKRRAMHKHALGIERAFVMGTKYETLEDGQPKRHTGGVLDFIPSENIIDVAGANGALDFDEFESYFETMFAYGSSEKLAYGSLGVMMAFQQVVRKNSDYNFEQGQTEYGMKVNRFVSPAGTLTMTEHPLFGQQGEFLADSLLVLDTENIAYRYITDTTYLKDRQQNGDDGDAHEFLTEAGLEVKHGETHSWIRGIKSGKADD